MVKKSMHVLVSSLIFILLAISLFQTLVNADSPRLILEDKVFYAAYPVHITISANDYISAKSVLVAAGGGATRKFMGYNNNSLEFMPNLPGNYTLTLYSYDGVTLAKKTIEVLPILEKFNDSLSIASDVYYVNDEMQITLSNLNDNDLSMIISSNYTYQKYMGVANGSVAFVPKLAANYSVELYYKKHLVSKKGFRAINNVNQLFEAQSSNVFYSNVSFINNTGIKKGDFFEIYDSKGNKTYSQIRRVKSFQTDEEKVELELNDRIKKISFNDLKGNAALIGIDHVKNNQVNILNKRVFNSYAIDPSSLNFTIANVTATAIGNELYKCQDWNFTSQSCYGAWQKVMDIMPGKDYTFEITPIDPGFAETGVASINTNKSIYHIGEKAEILAAILNNDGYLSAPISLNITILSPDNITYLYNISNAANLSKGIYQVLFNETSSEGTYNIIVQAMGVGIDVFMITTFDVREYYDFDIIRTAPMSIDPWNQSINVNISLVSYNYSGAFTFTEKLPINLTVNDTNADLVYADTDFLYLVWHGLDNGSDIFYAVNAPLISPYLYALGPAEIIYLNNTFIESRPWLVAIDPSVDTNEGIDVGMAVLSEGVFVIAWIDAGTGVHASFEVWDVNGTWLLDETDIDISGDTTSRIDVAAINSTHFSIALIDGPSDDLDFYIYDIYGTLVYNGAGLNTNIGANTDVSVTQLGDRFAICDANDNNNDGEYYIRSNDGTSLSGPGNVDGNMGPANLNRNLVDCSAVSADRFVYSWYDDGGNDLSIALVNQAGTTVISELDIDLETGNLGGTAVAGLKDNNVAIAYYDNNANNIKLSVYDITGDAFTEILAPTVIDANTGTDSRVAVAEINHGQTSYFGVAFWDQNAGDIKVGIYDIDGAQITAPFIVETNEDNTYHLLDIISANSVITQNICDDTFVIAYTNSSNQLLFKAYQINGSLWTNGICDFEFPAFANESRNVTLIGQNVNVRFNITISDDKQIESWTFSWNNSGAWQNISTNSSVDVASVNATTTATVTAIPGTNVCYRWYATDLYGKTSATSDYCFEVSEDLGILSCTLIYPSSDLNVVYGHFFNFTAQVNCSGGECGNLNATLDPQTAVSVNETPDIEAHTASVSTFTERAGNVASLQTNVADPGAAADYLSYEFVNPNAINDVAQYFYYDVSSLNITGSKINSISFEGQLFLTGGYTSPGPETDPFECGNVGDAYMQIYNGSGWENADSAVIAAETGFNNGGGGGTVASWDSEAAPFTKIKDDSFTDDYINASGYISMRFYWQNVDCTVGETVSPDAAFVWDYGLLTINYTNGTDTKGVIPTTPGATPFWTSSDNPQDSSYQACLSDMGDGDSCDTVWSVNATGQIGSTWVFFVNYTSNDYPLSCESEHVNITIIDAPPPTISNIQCYEQGVGWETCINIRFGDTLEQVRADCDSNMGDPINNVRFILRNVQDNKIFFNGTTFDNSTGYFVYNNPDLFISDSGLFNLVVECSDSYGPKTSDYNWTVPFGTLQTILINPDSNSNVIKNLFFNFTANVSCVGGECGNLTVILDPIMNPYTIAFMDFESSDFPQDSQCNTAGQYCVDSTPWDDFDDCQSGAGQYGICSSSEADSGSSGAYGLECRGCDRADGGNNGGLYIEINSTACAGKVCDQIWISYYQVIQSADNANEGSAVFVYDDDEAYTLVSMCIDGDSNCDCDSITGCTRSLMGDYAQFIKVNLCALSGINCSQDLTVFFTSYNTVDHTTGDYFGWDEINVTGYRSKGIIPMNSGTPFYTTTINPMTSSDHSCLVNMTSGDMCSITWSVNATGQAGTTWEFFVISNSTTYFDDISSDDSPHINITIVNNTFPNVTSITLTPLYPITSENLTCSFQIYDPNTFDSFTANISWYRNNTYYSSVSIPVNISTLYNIILDSSNTNLGDIWHCGVKASDILGTGSQTNSSNVTVEFTKPPIINSIQCQQNGVAWTSCSNIQFGDTLTRVRANITDDGAVSNVSFVLGNADDDKIFFNNWTLDYAGGYYVFNNTDIIISDSGTFILNVTATDDLEYFRTTSSTWLVPFGSLLISWIYPDFDVNITVNKTGNFSVNVTCIGGECGNLNATLDPAPLTTLYDNFDSNDVSGYSNFGGGSPGTWTTVPYSGRGYILSQTSGTADDVFYNGTITFTGNYVVRATIMSTDNDEMGVAFRINTADADNFYSCYANSDGGVGAGIWRNINDVSGNPNTALNSLSWDFIEGRWYNVTIIIDEDTNTINCVWASSEGGVEFNITAADDDFREIGAVGFWVSNQADFYSDLLQVDEMILKSGTIPTGSGNPFYTYQENPMTYLDDGCLANMTANDNCEITWVVNATGRVGTTHTFFGYADSYNYYSSVPTDYTTNISVTITDNYAPVVSSVLISPNPAPRASDLNCTFSLIDGNTFDILSANVTWYRNNISQLSVMINNIIRGQEYTTVLGNGNTSSGEYWKCGVTPYDGSTYGVQSNSSDVGIIANYPPVISQIACENDGLSWQACTTIGFYDNVTRIRANCSSELAIINTTFTLFNLDKSKTYFSGSETVPQSGYYIYNNADRYINESGNYRLNVTCTDNESVTTKSSVSWLVPYGTLVATLVDPDQDVSVQKDNFFDFKSQVQCLGGECGNINAILDPYGLKTTYNYSSGYGSNKWAWEVDSDNDPPENSPNSRNVLTAGDITNIADLDDSRWDTIDPGAANYVSLEMVMTLDMSARDIMSLTFMFDGQPDNNANIKIYAKNISSNNWDLITTEFILADTDEEVSYTLSSGIDDYVNSSKQIRWLVLHEDTSNLMRVDYVGIDLYYKKGIVSTVPGAVPFYTTDDNPKNYNNQSCLFNMLAGDICLVTWPVNATGELDSTHTFYVTYNSSTLSSYVAEKDTAHINITISDVADVPPVITFMYPADNKYTNNSTVIFNCTATDNTGLSTISLYSDFSGIYGFDELKSVSGTINSTSFTKILDDGIYSWNCLAEDDDANTAFYPTNRTLIVDTHAPNITLHSPPPGDYLSNTTVKFNITVIDNLDSVLVCNLTIDGSVVDPNFNANNNTPIVRTQTDVSIESMHYWNVTCADEAGNSYTSETRNFSIADVPPEIYLMTPDYSFFSSSTVVLYWNATDNTDIINVSLRLNGLPGQWKGLGGFEIDQKQNFTLTGMLEGEYNWTVNVTDENNYTAQAPVRHFTVDYTAPWINISGPSDYYPSNGASVSINFTVYDNLDQILTCNITVNGAVKDPMFSADNGSLTTRTLTGLSDGLNYWNVTCIDDAGNFNTSETRVINVTGTPQSTLNFPFNLYAQFDTEVNFNYTPSDNDDVDECHLYVNGSFNQAEPDPVNNVPNYFTVAGLSEGKYNWSVWCNDTAGLTNMSQTLIFYIDQTKPVIIPYGPPPGEIVYGQYVKFNFTVTDNLDPQMLCNLTIDGSLNATDYPADNGTLTNITVYGLSETVHYWNLTCMDHAGNLNMTQTFNFTFYVPPTIDLVSPGDGDWLNTVDAALEYYPEDNQGINESILYINGAFNNSDDTVTSEASNYYYLYDLLEGTYTWRVSVMDTLGLITNSSIWSFTVDITPPNVSYMTPYQGEIIGFNNVTFRFNVTDNLDSQMLCNVTINGSKIYNNTPVNDGAALTYYKPLPDGDYNWSVVCIDNATNINSNILINFTVYAPPNVTLNSPINYYRSNKVNVTFNYTPDDIFGILNCTLYYDGTIQKNSSSINLSVPNYLNLTNLGHGVHNWTVMCVDNDANTYAPPEEYFIIDLLGPTMNLTQPYAGQFFNQDDILFNFTPIDDFGTAITCNLTLDGNVNITGIVTSNGTPTTRTIYNLSYGPHNWSVTCLDDLNNSNTSDTINFVVNAPDAYIDNNRITFNNSNPNLYDNITISVNIENLGGVAATDFAVEFWDGLPSIGTLIGNNTVTIPFSYNITTNITWIITPGHHNIWVAVNPGNAKTELDYANNNATKNISVLISNITSPENNTWTRDLTPQISFNLTDFTGGLINYTILIDGVPNGQTGQANDGSVLFLNISALAQTQHYMIVRARDSFGRIKDSARIYINIDNTSAVVNFITQNETWYNITTPTIRFNITDNLDTVINWSFYADGALANSSASPVNTNINQTVGPYAQGTHNITVQTLDEAGNTKNYSIVIYIDTTKPTVNLVTPIDGDNFTVTSVVLNMTVTDNLASSLDCDITLDGGVVRNGLAANGSYLSHTANGLYEGKHYWNASCSDEAGNLNYSETWNFNIFIAPSVLSYYPPNNYWSNKTNNTFYFNASDDTGIENCSLLINGAVNATKQGNEITLGEISNISSIISQGAYNWSVMCYDNTSFNVINVTANRTIYVDTTPPYSAIVTQNDSWYNLRNPLIVFNLTDNLANLINYTFYVNGIKNTTGQSANPTYGGSNIAWLSSAVDQTIKILAIDQAGNKYNSTPITVHYDNVSPSIALNSPDNGNLTNNDTVTFNFTVSDDRSPLADCNLTLDGVAAKNYTGVSVPLTIVETISGLSSGVHYWNVTCVDLAGNFNVSQTRNFTVPTPDLVINSGNITFSNPSAQEFENITIFANVFSAGNTKAQNIIVSFFSGDPDNGGVQIGANRTISLLNPGENQTVNMTWTAEMGTTDIYAVVDPPYPTGGAIAEDNETNNKAYKAVIISGYHIVAGNATSSLNVDNSVYETLFKWIKPNSTGDNIFVTDYESAISWPNLLAIGLNSTGGAEFNDFSEIDNALSMTNFTDSINKTYTSDGAAKQTRSFSVFTNTINNVPVVNSTINDNFVTGLLWDSDDGPNYNGTQDLVIITEMNIAKQGQNGIVDFEIRIPAALRQYKTADTKTVVFYSEIK